MIKIKIVFKTTYIDVNEHILITLYFYITYKLFKETKQTKSKSCKSIELRFLVYPIRNELTPIII